jgi:adenylate cyclase
MERRLAAILAADVVGYSRLMAIDESGTHARLKTLRREIVEPAIARHHGRVVKLMGDGALVEFASVVQAVECAVAIQDGVAEHEAERPGDQRIAFRIGINIGDILIEDDDIYGGGVNIAARLEALAAPGGICVSRNVYNQVKDKVPFGFVAMGEHRVKNIPEPVSVYRVLSGPGSASMVRGAGRTVVPRLRVVALIFVALLAGAAGLGLWHSWSPEPEPSGRVDRSHPSVDKPSLAVLPFDDLSADADEAYFADGLTDDLITDLAKISGLVVIARNSVFTYKGQAVDIREVARDLGVRYVLEGSVRRAGGRIRINAQLIDSESGGHLWTDRFDRDISDIFAVQDEVIGHIVDALTVQLSASEQQRLERPPTANLEAYDYFLRAEEAVRTGFRPKLSEALRLYEKATQLDPTFAEAFAADARTAVFSLRSNYDDVLPAPVARKRAYEHAGRALEIDPEASLPFAVLAILQGLDGQHEEALASAKRAVALGPSDAEAYTALSLVLTFYGRPAEAVVAIETAMRLNPSLPANDRSVAGLAFFFNDDYERAIEMLERARDEAPNVDDIQGLLTAAYAQAGRMDAARQAAAEAIRLAPNLCVELYRVVLAHLRREEDRAKILDAMIAGGLPRWPYGFTAGAAEALAAAEIRDLAFGRTAEGRIESGGPALAQIQPDGQMAFRTTTYMVTGVAFVVGDLLCERTDALSLGRPICGPVYRRPPPREDDLAYIYVNASKVFYFSPIE